MPFSPFSVLTSKIYGVIAVMALTFACVQTMRIEGFLFIHGYKQDLKEANDEIAGWKSANELAKAKVEERDRALETLNKELTDATNAISDAAFAGARPAIIRYRDAHRLSGDCARSFSPDPAPVSGDPQKPAEQALPPDMVAVPGPDYDLLTAAALQAAVEYEYFQALIRSGQAIPEPDMGAK